MGTEVRNWFEINRGNRLKVLQTVHWLSQHKLRGIAVNHRFFPDIVLLCRTLGQFWSSRLNNSLIWQNKDSELDLN